jgi:hypothetical protein
MPKAIEGAAMLAGAVATGVAEFALASTGVGAAALPFLTDAMYSLAAGGVAMEAGAIASALTANRGMNITTRQPAAARQIIYGIQRVGCVTVYQSTTGGSRNQYNFANVVAGHPIWGIEALYLDGRKVYWQGANPAHPSPYYLPSPLGGMYFGGESDGGSYEGPNGQQYSFNGLVLAAAYYGDQTAADLCGGFKANDPNWATSSAGTPYLGGCSWMYNKFEYDPTTFPTPPEVRVTVWGKPVHDPRFGHTTFSANAALVAADWISDTVYGLGMKVNQEQLIAAANVCDEQVALAAGGTEARYQCHYHFDTSTAPSDALATMLKAMGGRISVIGGEVYLWPAFWQGPSANFDQSILTAPVQWDSTAAYKDNCNSVTGTYTAPNYPYNAAGNAFDKNGFDSDGNALNTFQFGFTATSFPPYAEDPLHGYPANQWLDEDSGVSAPWDPQTAFALGQVVAYVSQLSAASGTAPYYSVYKSLIANNAGNTPGPSSAAWQLAAVNLPLEVNYNMVLSIAQAQRLAKIDMLRRRFWGRGTLEMGMAAFSMQETDVMYFSLPQHGWVDKVLEIQSYTFKTITEEGTPGQPPKPPEHRLVFEVAETDPSIYEWSAVEELSIYDVPAFAQGTNNTPTAPTGLTLESGADTALVNVDGIVTPRILATWQTPLDGLVTEIEVQYQVVGGNGVWLSAGNVSVFLNQAYISPVVAGNQYSVQIRSRRKNGAVSAWDGPVTITAGLVVSTVSQSGYGIGSLIANAYTDGTASIECNPFTAYVGQLSLPIFPGGPYTIPGLAQQTLYYVYYIDPNCLGGNVTPIATTRLTDFIGKQGYFLIDSIVTPYAAAVGGGGGGMVKRFAPSNYTDSGQRTTQNPSAAYDNNLSTSATVSGKLAVYKVGVPGIAADGECTWAGFPSGVNSADSTLTIVASVSVASEAAPGGTVSLAVSIGGSGAVVATLSETAASTDYTCDIPAGTDRSTVSVAISATAGDGSAEDSSSLVTCSVAEIYIQ